MTKILVDREVLEQVEKAFALILRNLAAGGGSKSINKLFARSNQEYADALRALLDAPSESKVMSKAFCNPKRFDDEDLAYNHDYLNE
jgi:hypothetical protein